MAFGQEAKHDDVVIAAYLAQPGVAQRDDRSRASMWLSVLSLRPESSRRTRADSAGGTSSTLSPVVTSCWAARRCRSRPPPPIPAA
jgi:hypothetical protein